MNRKLFVLPVMGAMLLIGINLFANSVDYSTAQSASFIMMGTRQAATDSADIIAYNPAGEALIAPGLYLSVSEQYYFMHYEQTFKSSDIDETYKDNRPIPIFPNAYVLYNMGKVGDGNLAFGLKSGVIAGGGNLDWNGTTGTAYAASLVASTLTGIGKATTVTGTDIKQKVSSVYYGFGGNVAYSMFNDMVSVSVGGQYIYAEKTAETTGTLNFNTASFGGAWDLNLDSKFDCDANGYNMIFGVDVRPVKQLTLAVSYETDADLKFKYHQDSDGVTPEGTSDVFAGIAAGILQAKLNKAGAEENNDLPAILRMGAEYQFTPDFLVAMGGELFFVNNMDYNGIEDYYSKVGWEFNVGAQYAVIPSLLKIAAGITIADVGGTPSLFSSEDAIATMGANDWSRNIFMTSCGFTYTIIKDLDLVVGYAHLITADGKEKFTTDSGYKVSYYRGVDNIAVQVNYKVF